MRPSDAGAAPLHALRYVPVRHREHVAELGCDVSRVVGYRAVCSCGWRGKVYATVAHSRADAAAHVAPASAHGANVEAK